ncbi:hypothetical protein PBY51_003552 [Eleginops maclovinus]|uniref:Uncharacterized protein n=1 Tax=Eleginops maclovinus TaxID=56733 RepID=A0AAN7Y1M4_ELEMC|nr:hypothetical protein PBY51_003552 [Eleginops maclovinus]
MAEQSVPDNEQPLMRQGSNDSLQPLMSYDVEPLKRQGSNAMGRPLMSGDEQLLKKQGGNDSSKSKWIES